MLLIVLLMPVEKKKESRRRKGTRWCLWEKREEVAEEFVNPIVEEAFVIKEPLSYSPPLLTL